MSASMDVAANPSGPQPGLADERPLLAVSGLSKTYGTRIGCAAAATAQNTARITPTRRTIAAFPFVECRKKGTGEGLVQGVARLAGARGRD